MGKFKFLSSGSSCFFLAVSPRFLVLDPRDRMGGKVGNACDEFDDNEGGILG